MFFVEVLTHHHASMSSARRSDAFLFLFRRNRCYPVRRPTMTLSLISFTCSGISVFCSLVTTGLRRFNSRTGYLTPAPLVRACSRRWLRSSNVASRALNNRFSSAWSSCERSPSTHSGSPVPRSRCSVSEYSASAVSAVWNRPFAPSDAPAMLGLNALRPFRLRFDPLHRLIEISPSY